MMPHLQPARPAGPAQPLDVNDEESIEELLLQIDMAIQVGGWQAGCILEQG